MSISGEELDIGTEEPAEETETPEDVLFKAILNNDLEMVKVKLSEGLTALTRSSYGDIALHFACLNSKLDILNVLKDTLRKEDINTINIEDDDTICGTALHMSMDGQVDPAVVQALLQWGADANARDAKGSPVLHELIYRAFEDLEDGFESEESMWEDLETGSEECKSNEVLKNFDDISDDYDHSMGNSYFEKLRLLHEHGVDMNLVHSETGLSPLHFWCQSFHLTMEKYIESGVPEWCVVFLKMILKYGADPNAVNERGETPWVFLAQRHYKPNHVEFMTTYRNILSLIIPVLSDIEKRDMYQRTLLHTASEFCNCVLLEELLKLPCDVNLQDKFGLSPLHIITHCISTDESPFVRRLIACLVERGANVNVVDNHGSTPLHHAVHLKNHAALELILKLGALVDIKDKSGKTVNDLALLEGDSDVLKLLGIEHKLENEVVPGVSDIRFGWFYPLCCHKQYSGESRGIEESEKVKDKSIDQWLKTYPMCVHNSKFILQNSISSLESNKEEMFFSEIDADLMKREIYEFAKKAADRIGTLHPLFQSNVVFGGSVSEGTKVGSADEFDLVFDLFRFRDHLEVIEDPENFGFARLKVLKPEEFSKYGLESLVDDEGLLKRSETSNTFHKFLEKAIRSKELVDGNNFFAYCGTTNSLGECFNIGQLHLVWYGSFQKRQTVSVDIAPVIRVGGWKSIHTITDTKIVNKKTANTAGYYLVMKDASPIFDVSEIETDDSLIGDREYPNLEKEDTLFKISLSQLEHATMKFLPPAIKNGYKLAKSIQLQCPQIIFSLHDIMLASMETEFGDHQTHQSIIHVSEYITSYVLKTGLFHEMDSQGLLVPFGEADLSPREWNTCVTASVLENLNTVNKKHVIDSVWWALRIYKRLLMLVEQNKRVPAYFLPVMDATKIRGGTKPFVKVCTIFLKVLIHFLEHFQIPDDMFT